MSWLARSLTLRTASVLAATGMAVAWAAQPAATTVEVPVLPVRAQPVAAGLMWTGMVEPVRQSTLSAQASGRVASLLVKAGDRVRAGQLLATIDDRDTQAGLARSQAQVAQAEAEYRNAQANARRTSELKDKGFVSQSALDSAQTQLQAAAAARAQAGAAARQSGLAQDFTRLTAPYDGLVWQTLAQAGDLAVPGKPILTVYAARPLRATVQVPVSQSETARAARGVQVQIPTAQGASEWVTPSGQQWLSAADPVSQTLEWRLLLPDSVAAWPGQQVQVRVDGVAAPRTLVPASALLRRGELTAVYVVSKEGFALRAVRTGADHGSAGVEVLAGLAADDRVALDAVRAGLAGARPAARAMTADPAVALPPHNTPAPAAAAPALTR